MKSSARRAFNEPSLFTASGGATRGLPRFELPPVLGASAAILTSTVLTALLGVVFWGVQSHLFPAELVGQGTTLMSLAATASLVTTAGLAPALLLAIPRASSVDLRTALTLWSAAGAAVVAGAMSLLAGLVLPILNPTFAFLRSPLLVAATAIVAAGSAAHTALDAALVADRRAGAVPVKNTALAAAKAALVTGMALAGMAPAVASSVSWALASIVTAVAAGWFVTRGPRLPPGSCRLALNVLKAELGHHHAASLGGALPPVLLPVLVTAILGTEASALFSIAWMLGAAFFMVSPAVSSALLASGAETPDLLAKRVRSAAKLITALLAVPLGVALLLPETLLSMFGAQYRAAGLLLVLLALAAIPDAITNVAVAVYRVQGRLARVTAVNVGMGFLTVAGSCLLMPVLGITALGWAWLGSQSLGSLTFLMFPVTHPQRRKVDE